MGIEDDNGSGGRFGTSRDINFGFDDGDNGGDSCGERGDIEGEIEGDPDVDECRDLDNVGTP